MIASPFSLKKQVGILSLAIIVSCLASPRAETMDIQESTAQKGIPQKGPLDRFSETEKNQWVTKLTRPLEVIAQEIELNKSALTSINNELAYCLNTEWPQGDESIIVVRTKGIFATSPVKNCETDFLNPLLATVQKITSSAKNVNFSEISMNSKDFDDFEDLYWPFAYADNPAIGKTREVVKAWKEGEGKKLTMCIETLAPYVEELQTLIFNYKALNSFLESFSSKKRADINVITTGCAKDWQQQVYPWVMAFAKQKPNLTFGIDLFDKWDSGVPEFVKESGGEWKAEEGGKYTYGNIKVNVRTYILTAENCGLQPGYFVTDFHNVLSTLIRKQLKKNVVIISQHMGGYALDRPFIHLYNQIHFENNDLKKRLFLATHQGGFGPTAYVHNQIPCEKMEIQFDQESLLKLFDNEELFQRVRLYCPKVWDLKQDYQKWVSEGSKTPSPIEAFLAEKKGRDNPRVSTLGEVWVKDLYSEDDHQ